MPIRTGGSHAVASLTTLLVGALLSEYVSTVAPPVTEFSLLLLTGLEALGGVPIARKESLAGSLLVILVLSFVWGVGYHVARYE